MPRDPLIAYLARPTRRRLAKVVAAYYRTVWQLALKLTANEDDAADITQDVFLHLSLDPPKPERVTSPSGFLSWRVVDRTSRYRRAVERARKRDEAYAQRLADATDASDEKESVREALDQLPPDERTLLELRYLAGLTTAEVAQLLGVGERSTRSRLEKARGKLRDRLSPLFAGTVAWSLSSSTVSAAPPPQLLDRLLQAIEVSSALAPVTATATASTMSFIKLGGSIVNTKKIISVAAVCGLLSCGVTYLFVVRNTKEPTVPADTSSPRVVPDESTSKAAPSDPTETKAATAVVTPTEQGVPYGIRCALAHGHDHSVRRSSRRGHGVGFGHCAMALRSCCTTRPRVHLCERPPDTIGDVPEDLL